MRVPDSAQQGYLKKRSKRKRNKKNRQKKKKEKRQCSQMPSELKVNFRARVPDSAQQEYLTVQYLAVPSEST